MRHFILSSLLCLVLGAQALQASKQKQHCSEDNRQNNCCSCQYVIPSKELNKGKGFVIEKPGVYCLDGNARFAPKFSKYTPPDPRAVQAAITVKPGVSNVTIDLGNYRLTQADSGKSNQIPFVIGILVPDPDPANLDSDYVGTESIYIKGDQAIIDGFSMYGVRIFAHISDIQLDNLTIKNCGALASKALRPTVYSQPYLPHDQATGSAFGPSFGVSGLSIGESVGFGEGPIFFNDVSTKQLNVVNRTQNVRLKNVSCLNNFMRGAWIKRTTNLTIENCHFDYTWTDDPGTAVSPAYPAIPAVGMVFNDAQNFPSNGNSDPGNVTVFVSNSTFNNSSLRGDYTTPIATGSTSFIAYGCSDVRSQNSTYVNCQFNSSSSTFPAAVGTTTTTGGFVSGGIEDASFIDCSFDASFNLSGVNGVHVSGNTSNELIKSPRTVRFIRCTSNNHQCRTDLILPAPVLNTRTIQGFNLSFGKDFYLEDCVSSDLYLSGPGATTGGTSAGFAPQSSSNNPQAQAANWVFKNCRSERVIANDGGCVAGFNTFVAPSNVATSFIYEDCESNGHQANLASTFPTWLGATSYSVGARVVFSGVNYVSLVNANLNNQPNTSPAQWGILNSSPAAWLSTTSYALGAQVSFTDTTGHTNEYISAIAGNLGNYPNAPGPSSGGVPNWIQTNIYPSWKSTATYQAGSLVGYQGKHYRSLVASNTNFQPDISAAQWSTTTNVVQLAASGFFSQQVALAGPEIYQNCKASQIVGPLVGVVQAGVTRYTAGFATQAANGTEYKNCIASQNPYGFLLSGSTSCVVSHCEANNNLIEGFTDIGTGTPAAPGQSTSLFEANSAYNNGTNNTHVGPNNNYNIWVDAALTLRPMLLQCKNSTASCTLSAPSTDYFGGKHNISTIK